MCAQWCPPCRALLPELRKASIQLAGQMKFGTLDCTIHHDLCSMVTTQSVSVLYRLIMRWRRRNNSSSSFSCVSQQYNIQAYPTTVIFNGSSVHEYEGQHSADGILEFIQVWRCPHAGHDSPGDTHTWPLSVCLSLQDLVNPSVVVLDPSSFAERVKGKTRKNLKKLNKRIIPKFSVCVHMLRGAQLSSWN